MWGADLHDGDNVSAKIEEAALGGVPGSAGVADLRDELESSVKTLITSRATNVDSFRRLQTDLKARDAEMKEIRMRAGEYAELQREQVEIGHEVERLDGDRLELRREIDAREALLAVAAERGELEQVRADLADLEVVPDAWSELAVVPDRVADAVAQLDGAERALEAASKRLRAARDAAGLSDEQAARATVAQPEVLTVTRLGQQLDTAQSDLERSEEHLRDCRMERDDRQGKFARARSAANGLTVEQLQAVTIDNDHYAEINAKIAHWSAADAAVASKEDEFGKCQRRLDEATETAQRDRDAWDRFGTGCTAQEWLRTGGTTVTSSPLRRQLSEFWVLAAAAVVSVVSSFVLPRLAWSIVTLAAFALAFVSLRSGWGRSGDDAPGEAAPSEAAAAAAEKVLRSEGLVDEAERALSVAGGDLTSAVGDRDSKEHSARERAAASGVDLGSAPDESSAELGAVNAAVEALKNLDAASSAMVEAEAVAARHRATTESLAEELREFLDGCGVSDRVRVDGAAEVIALYQDVTLARAARATADGDVEAARRQYRALVEPVEGAIGEHDRSWVVGRCRDLAAIVGRREQLRGEEKSLGRLIDNRMSGDERARELQHAGQPADALELEKEQHEEQLADLEREREALHERVGRIDERLEDIAQESELARLSAEVGSLEDAADDRVIDGAAHAVALALLTQVAEEQRQANQPALVMRASELLSAVQSEWERILVSHDGSDAEVSVRSGDGSEVSLHQLSTGARALVYLSLRLAMADQDAEKRGFRFPIICDDPLVHIDDQRAPLVLPLLAEAAARGHQVILFTCHGRTVDAAESVGARIVPLAGGIG
jgi:hypothetical protein